MSGWSWVVQALSQAAFHFPHSQSRGGGGSNQQNLLFAALQQHQQLEDAMAQGGHLRRPDGGSLRDRMDMDRDGGDHKEGGGSRSSAHDSHRGDR